MHAPAPRPSPAPCPAADALPQGGSAAASPDEARMRDRFRPTLPGVWPTLLLVLVVPLCLALGQWQWNKAEREVAARSLRDARAAAPAQPFPATLLRDAEALRYRQVHLAGEYLVRSQILLDNQVRHGQAGVNVLTPLQPSAGGPLVLVDRGWLPAPARHDAHLAPPVPAGVQAVRGTVWLPPTHSFRLAADTAPAGNNARWQGLDLPRYAAASGLPLQPVVIRLDPAAAHGFLREWPLPGERQTKHRSYALQWWAFAATAVGLWGFFLFRRPGAIRSCATSNACSSTAGPDRSPP